MQLLDRPCIFTRDLDRRLVTLDFAQGVPFLDLCTLFNEPLDYLHLFDALADVT